MLEGAPGEEYPDWETSLPELPAYPDDIEGWLATDRNLTGQCLNLRNRITGSQIMIEWAIEYSMDELGIVLDEHIAGRGLEAWSLASNLRQKHGLEEADAVWDYADGLKWTLDGAKAVREERRQKQDSHARPSSEKLAVVD